jgi:hypothetical protein
MQPQVLRLRCSQTARTTSLRMTSSWSWVSGGGEGPFGDDSQKSKDKGKGPRIVKPHRQEAIWLALLHLEFVITQP